MRRPLKAEKRLCPAEKWKNLKENVIFLAEFKVEPFYNDRAPPSPLPLSCPTAALCFECYQYKKNVWEKKMKIKDNKKHFFPLPCSFIQASRQFCLLTKHDAANDQRRRLIKAIHKPSV